MRVLAQKKHGETDLAKIRQTPIDEIIEMFEPEKDAIAAQNEDVLNNLLVEATESKNAFMEKIKKLEIEPKETASLLMTYHNFDKEMIRMSMDNAEIKKSRPRCHICRGITGLIKCEVLNKISEKCDMQVHSYCYPKLPKNYKDSSFLCENCEKGLGNETSCIFCPMKGGDFLEVESISQTRTIFNVKKLDGSSKIVLSKRKKEKKSFIHLSCSLWHGELVYNIEKGCIQNIHRVDRKKNPNSSCYECGTNIGVTIPCANENCRRFFHPECSRRVDLSICIITSKDKRLIELYCDRHRLPYSFEILRENIINNLKEIKRMYEGIDHEIKRITNHQGIAEKKTTPNLDYERHENCMVCSLPNEMDSKIHNCRKCYNWYHEKCSKKCMVCEQ